MQLIYIGTAHCPKHVESNTSAQKLIRQSSLQWTAHYKCPSTFTLKKKFWLTNADHLKRKLVYIIHCRLNEKTSKIVEMSYRSVIYFFLVTGPGYSFRRQRAPVARQDSRGTIKTAHSPTVHFQITLMLFS